MGSFLSHINITQNPLQKFNKISGGQSMVNDNSLSLSLSNEFFPEEYQFNLSDFALFLSVMKNKKAYQNTLSIILDEEDIELEEVKVEQVILNRSGKRAIRLDAWAKSKDQRLFEYGNAK